MSEGKPSPARRSVYFCHYNTGAGRLQGLPEEIPAFPGLVPRHSQGLSRWPSRLLTIPRSRGIMQYGGFSAAKIISLKRRKRHGCWKYQRHNSGPKYDGICTHTAASDSAAPRNRVPDPERFLAVQILTRRLTGFPPVRFSAP